MHFQLSLMSCIFSCLVTRLDTQTLVLCNSPEKYSSCRLSCITENYSLKTVSFSHPPNPSVGSCQPTSSGCKSNYQRYALSRKEDGRNNITYFNIKNLNRTLDQGKWSCAYDVNDSVAMTLTVHTRPENVKIYVNESTLVDKDITVTCSCACVYPEGSVSMEMQISNEGRAIQRNLERLQYLNASNHGIQCDNEEKVARGSVSVNRNQWIGSHIDIKCICREEVLNYMHTAKHKYKFEGIPEPPTDIDVVVLNDSTVLVTWRSGLNGGYNQSFNVTYRSINPDKSIQNTIVQEVVSKIYYDVSISGLNSDTLYNIWISAFNKRGYTGQVGPKLFKSGSRNEQIPLRDHTNNEQLVYVIIGWVSAISILIVVVCVLYAVRKKRRKAKAEKGDDTAVLLTDKSDNNDEKITSLRESITSFREEVSANYTSLREETHRMRNYVQDLSIGNTKMLIQDRVKTNIVKTAAIIVGEKVLEKCGILIYVGAHGSGMRTNAYHIMNNWIEKGYDPVILDDITKWDEKVNTQRKMIILIPYLISRAISAEDIQEKDNYYLKIMSAVKGGKITIIITCLSVAFAKEFSVLQTFDLFNSDHQIHLFDSKYKLTTCEKKEILKTHCTKNISISPDEIEEISELELFAEDIGYPAKCSLLCKNEKNRRHAVEFFRHPSKYLINDISNLMNTNEKAWDILQTLWMNSQDSQCVKLEGKDKTTLKYLTKHYIVESEGQYEFKHDTVYIAVGLVIEKKDRILVILQSKLNFLKFHLSLEKQQKLPEKKVSVLTKYQINIIKNKCCQDLSPDRIYRFCIFIMECWRSAAHPILDEMKKYPHANSSVEESCNLENGIFVEVCNNYGDATILKLLLERYNIKKNVVSKCKSNDPEIKALLQRYLAQIDKDTPSNRGQMEEKNKD